MHFPASHWPLVPISILSFFITQTTLAQTTPTDTLVLQRIKVVDITSGHINKNQTVQISSGRIISIRKYQKKNQSVNGQVIDAKGKYLIPGLWDMHVHISQGPWFNAEKTFALMIANGITGIREMGGNLNILKKWKEQINDGSLLGPRMIIAGPVLYGDRNIGLTYLATPDVFTSRRIVDSLKLGGVDFIKTYNFIGREQFFAIADETKKLNLSFAGHVPWSVSIIEAADAGLRSLEHLNFPFFAEECAKDAARFRRMDVAKIFQFSRPFDRNSAPAFIEQLHYLDSALLQFDQQKADTIYHHLVMNHVWQCPTIINLKMSVNIRDSNLLKDSLMKYAYYSRIQNDWNFKNIPLMASMGDKEFLILQRLYKKHLGIARDLKERGTLFLAGTDLINPFIYPGFSLHKELEMFVETGFTNLEALQTSTINPAIFLGLADSLGSIDEHKYADLIILNENPLRNISNIRTIEAVIVRGMLYSRNELNLLLESVTTKK